VGYGAAVKDWEVIADNLSKSGWSWGWVSAVNCEGRKIWIADAHRGDEKRFVVHADDKLTAFVELEKNGLYPAIERTMLTIIATITFCVAEEKLTAFIDGLS
jgi:hypothetical protein